MSRPYLQGFSRRSLTKRSCILPTPVGSMPFEIRYMPTESIISDAEWKVMRVLWKKAPQPAYDIIQELGASESWHQNTVKALLARLHKKKVLGVKKYKNLYLYSPLVTEQECIQ